MGLSSVGWVGFSVGHAGRLLQLGAPLLSLRDIFPRGGRITVALSGRFGFARHREPRRPASATVVLPRFGGGGAKRRRGPLRISKARPPPANPGTPQRQQEPPPDSGEI